MGIRAAATACPVSDEKQANFGADPLLCRRLFL
jgi:hypothetical protein